MKIIYFISLNTIYEKSNSLEGGTEAFGFLMKAPGLLNCP